MMLTNACRDIRICIVIARIRLWSFRSFFLIVIIAIAPVVGGEVRHETIIADAV